jgi:CubicO group peptidase (beta-lactamase class C family)
MKRSSVNALPTLALLALTACGHVIPGGHTVPAAPRGRVPPPQSGLDGTLAELTAKYKITTSGIGIIRNGKLVWTGYFGEERPGVRAMENTRFNVASITKTVAAEAALRLVHEGKLELDAPLSPYWTDPDVANDPRKEQLTARMVLTHTTGFPNWRFFRADGKLVFQHDPGTTYGYSGEGFQYLAHALENKLGQPFPRLVATRVFQPIGMNAVVEAHREGVAHLARAVDENGVFPGHYCRPNGTCRDDGSYSAADDMAVTVPDYAKFLASVMRSEGYGTEMAKERDRIQTDKGKDRIVDCAANAAIECPRSQGYGLGFEVVDYEDFKVIGHGGSDWSELTVAYFYEPSHDAVIVFLNAPNRFALSAMPEFLALLDPRSPYLVSYRAWLEREIKNENAQRQKP